MLRIKRRIAVVTQSCFLQCDTLILPSLSDDCEVLWNIFLLNSDIKSESELGNINSASLCSGIQIHIHKLTHRLRSFQTIIQFASILREIQKYNPDVVYINAMGHPWLAPLIRFVLGSTRVIWAIHDVRDHHIRSRFHPVNLYRKFLFSSFQNFHLLSLNQLRLFKSLYPKKTALYAPHAPIDYGASNCKPVTKYVQFLFFGRIAPRKGVEILIQAAELLYQEGHKNFKVVIAGKCDDWATYSKYIRHPEIFELHIQLIPDCFVADLYKSSHWLVLPYRDLTQSGPMSLAFHYNLPTITSNLPEFDEFVLPNFTGIPFVLDDIHSLKDAMLVGLSFEHQSDLKLNQLNFFNARYSLGSCIAQYKEMFSI